MGNIFFPQRVCIIIRRGLWQTTEGKGKPFQQTGAPAQQGRSSALSGCHGNLLDTGRVRDEGCTFFSLIGLFAQLYSILHICNYGCAVLGLCFEIRAPPRLFHAKWWACQRISAFRDRHVNKACMSRTSCLYITNAAVLAGALAEHSRTNIAQAARWWPNWCIHAIGHTLAQYSRRTLSGWVLNTW